jgi:hypothetical protein
MNKLLTVFSVSLHTLYVHLYVQDINTVMGFITLYIRRR